MEAGLGMNGDWRALETLITGVHGRPVERVEQVDERIDVRTMTPEQRRALMTRGLEDHPQLVELIPARLRPVDG